MSEPTRIKGDVEIIDALGRRYDNVIGSSINPASVPMVLEAVHGFTDVHPVDPEPTGSVTPVAQWQGTTGDGVTVTAKLWEDPGFDPVALAERLRAEQGGV